MIGVTQPAHHEEAERGHQHQAAPDLPPLVLDPPAVTHERDFWIKILADYYHDRRRYV